MANDAEMIIKPSFTLDIVSIHRHTQIAIAYCNSTNPGRRAKEGTRRLKRKVKLKAKGKKYYQNTHGKIYRVKPNPKLNKRMLLEKVQRRIDAQVKA